LRRISRPCLSLAEAYESDAQPVHRESGLAESTSDCNRRN